MAWFGRRGRIMGGGLTFPNCQRHLFPGRISVEPYRVTLAVPVPSRRTEPVKYTPFRMERWQSTYEHRVGINLSESGVHPMTVAELLALAGMDEGVDEIRLGYGQSNGSDELRARPGGFRLATGGDAPASPPRSSGRAHLGRRFRLRARAAYARNGA